MINSGGRKKTLERLALRVSIWFMNFITLCDETDDDAGNERKKNQSAP